MTLYGPVPKDILAEVRERVALADKIEAQLRTQTDSNGALLSSVSLKLNTLALAIGPYRRIAERGLADGEDPAEMGVCQLIRIQLDRAKSGASTERKSG